MATIEDIEKRAFWETAYTAALPAAQQHIKHNDYPTYTRLVTKLAADLAEEALTAYLTRFESRIPGSAHAGEAPA